MKYEKLIRISHIAHQALAEISEYNQPIGMAVDALLIQAGYLAVERLPTSTNVQIKEPPLKSQMRKPNGKKEKLN